MKNSIQKIKSRVSSRSSKIEDILVNHAEFQRSRDLRSEILFGRGIIRSRKWMTPLLKNKESRHFIITDTNVSSFYEEGVSTLLYKNGISHECLAIPAGEKSKSFQICEIGISFSQPWPLSIFLFPMLFGILQRQT